MERAAATFLQNLRSFVCDRQGRSKAALSFQDIEFLLEGKVVKWRKNCLANNYGFVIIRWNYDKNVTFLQNWPATVRRADRLCMLDTSCH